MRSKAMSQSVLIGASIVALFFSSCTSDVDRSGTVGPDANAPNSSNRYVATREKRFQYQGYDSQGKQIVKGMLTLVIGNSNDVTGKWQFYATGDRTGIGPQVGSGRLIGSVDARTLWLSLNPDYADNNVFLMGAISGGVFQGSWEYVGFAGILSKGTFRAVQLNVRSIPTE